jgi:hypothetical protein
MPDIPCNIQHLLFYPDESIRTAEFIDHFEFFVDDPENEVRESADDLLEKLFHGLLLYIFRRKYKTQALNPLQG